MVCQWSQTDSMLATPPEGALRSGAPRQPPPCACPALPRLLLQQARLACAGRARAACVHVACMSGAPPIARRRPDRMPPAAADVLSDVATDSDEGEAWVEDMSGEPSGAPNDEGEPVVRWLPPWLAKLLGCE